MKLLLIGDDYITHYEAEVSSDVTDNELLKHNEKYYLYVKYQDYNAIFREVFPYDITTSKTMENQDGS